MKDEKLQKGIEEIRKIGMTNDEKNRILKHILHSPIIDKPVKSPWTAFSFVSSFRKNHLFYYTAISLFIILSGGGVVVASKGSLPGNILYNLKVSVVEPITGTFIFSPEAKIKYESGLAVKRLVEAETLATENKLDPAKEKQLNDLLISHTTALDKALASVDQTQATEDEQVSEVVSNFHAEMNAHAKILDLITTSQSSDNIQTQQNERNIQISNTARINGDNIKNSFKREDPKNENTAEVYDKKKEIVKEIIKSTATKLDENAAAAPVESSPIKQSIINDTQTTLKQAEQLLNEADKKDKEGDPQSAYSSLLQSENSAKEAKIFLKAGLELKDGNKDSKGENPEGSGGGSNKIDTNTKTELDSGGELRGLLK